MIPFMSGYKTYAGAVLIAASAVLGYAGMPEHADSVLRVGEALGISGIGHKLVKSRGVG